jgi:hypothetical protein
MPEPPKSQFLTRIIEGKDQDGDAKAFTSERQFTAQAFNLHVERKDGRHSEGFAWSHYAGYEWADEGDHEKLTVIFGPRAVEIEGHNLSVLVAEIREGQLNSIRELATAQAALKQANAEDEPIISSIRTYPDFEQILKDIKGEDDDQHRHVKRVAGR